MEPNKERSLAHKSLAANGAEMNSAAQNAGEKVGRMATDLSRSAEQYLKSSRHYVAQNPATGVAIAAATGAIIGSLVTAAMRRKS